MTRAEERLKAVRDAALGLEEARLRLESAIRDARPHKETGWSLRTIAEAANVSHEQVRRILAS